MKKDNIFPILSVTIIIILFIMIARKNTTKTWSHIINKQIELYPKIEPVDIYKIVYQGVMGPNHLTKTKETMAHYLTIEFNEIDEDTLEQLVERISPDDKYIRINLKRYKANSGNIEHLSEMVYRSCIETDREELKKVLSLITLKIQKRSINYPPEKWEKYYQKITGEDFFVPHHSEIYLQEYNPAYRVVASEVWKKYTQ